MPVIASALVGFFLLAGALGGQGSLPSQAEAAPVLPSYSVRLTGYNAVSWQTDADPSVTASGAFSNPEVVAARSHDLAKELPFGTVIAVTGPADKQNSCGFGAVSGLIGYRVIADTMNESMHQHVDILFANDASIPLGGGKSLNASNVLGVCDGVTITVVGRIRMKDIPKTQAELAALVEGTRAPLAVADK